VLKSEANDRIGAWQALQYVCTTPCSRSEAAQLLCQHAVRRLLRQVHRYIICLAALRAEVCSVDVHGTGDGQVVCCKYLGLAASAEH
jgi:hypothetical protein